MATEIDSGGPLVPGRSAPPVPSRPAPPAPTPSASNEAWTPLKMSNTTSNPAARKKPVIEVVGARPMSQVGFRDEKPAAQKLPPPPKRPGPPSRPKSMVPQNQGLPPKPARPASLIYPSKDDTAQLIDIQPPSTFENDAFAETPTSEAANSSCLIDFDNEPVGAEPGSANSSVSNSSSNRLYPDLLASLNDQPDIAVTHDQPDIAVTHQAEEREGDIEPSSASPPRVQPSAAMSSLAAAMTQGFKKRPGYSDSDEDEWGEDAEKDHKPSAVTASTRPLPSAPENRSLPSAPAPGNRPLPSTPAPGRPLSSAPVPGRPLSSAPVPGNRPLPSIPPPRRPLSSAPAPVRPLSSAPAPNRPLPFAQSNTSAIITVPPPPIPSRSNIPSDDHISDTASDSSEHSDKVAHHHHPPQNAAMAQLAAIMKQGKGPHQQVEKDISEDKKAPDPSSIPPPSTKPDFNDSFYSENEQSMIENESKQKDQEVPNPGTIPQKNHALSSLADVFNTAPQKPLKPAPSLKPKPALPNKPKPGLKPKPATKPKPSVMPKPGMRSSTSAMANLAAVMRGDQAETQDRAHSPQVSPRLKQSQSDYSLVSESHSDPHVVENAKNEEREESQPRIPDKSEKSEKSEYRKSAVHKQYANSPWMKEQDNKEQEQHKEQKTSSSSHVSAVHRQFGSASWMKPKDEVEKEKKVVEDSKSSDDEEGREADDKAPVAQTVEDPVVTNVKKPGPAPMRATYRPTIIKPTIIKPNPKPKTPEPEANNNAPEKAEPAMSKALSMFNLETKEEKSEEPVAMRPKKRPTIIRPPSLQNIAFKPEPAKEEQKQPEPKQQEPKEPEPKRPEPRPIPRDRPRPTPRSRMSSALSMPNLAADPSSHTMMLQDINFDDPPSQKDEPPPKKPPAPSILRTSGAPPGRPRPPSVNNNNTNLKVAPRVGSSMMNLSSQKKTPPPRPQGGPPPRPASGPRRASIGSAPGNAPRQQVIGLPPTLPERPGPGHPLYHYVVSGPHGIALYDYEASQQGDLSFKAGDVVELSSRVDDEWLEGSCGGSSGMCPAVFLDIIEPPPDKATTSATHHHTTPSSSPRPSTTSSMTGPRCVARYDYDSDAPEDLAFQADDMIRLEAWVDDNGEWLRGEIDGRRGLFPATFVEILEEPPRPPQGRGGGDADSMDSQDSNTDNTVTALYDFSGEASGDLSFKAGDKIRVLSQVNPEWLYGQHGSAEGQFPITFVDRVPKGLPEYQPDNTPATAAETGQSVVKEQVSSSTSSLSTLGTCTAQYPYPGESEGDLAFPQGAVITILEHVDSDWIKGEWQGTTGIFPAGFVTMDGKTETAQVTAKTSSPGEAEALFDFLGESDGDLPFKTGDKITLLEVLDEAWMRGELNGTQGMFPANFVNVIKPPT